MDKTTSTNSLIKQSEKAVMAEDPDQNLPVKPQQLIGGINGMILQLHKMNSKLEESQQNQEDLEEKIKRMDAKDARMREEISDLVKTKERLTEQSAFLEKSLQRQKQENGMLLERLKETEVQLGESGTVLDTVRNLESKNEMLNVKMSTMMMSTEEEIAKVVNERDHYLKLMEETQLLNERNKAMHETLLEQEKKNNKEQEKVVILMKKNEEGHQEIAGLLEELRRAREGYAKEQEGTRMSSVALEEENRGMAKKIHDYETKCGGMGRNIKELRTNIETLKGDLAISEKEKEKLKKEVIVFKERLATATRLARAHTTSAEKAQRTQQNEMLEKQIKILVTTFGNTFEQLENLKESVEENKDLLKANILSVSSYNAELENVQENGVEHDSMFSQEYFEVVVQMQDVLKHLQIRDEELSNLEKLAGLPVNSEREHGTSLVSSVRALIKMKDAEIKALEDEKEKLVQEIDEMKSSGYKQTYVMEEMQKDKEDIVAKMTAYQEKYRRLEDEKEYIRKELLVKNATDKMTDTHIQQLKNECEKCRKVLVKCQDMYKRNADNMRSGFDKKLEEKDKTMETMRSRLNDIEKENQQLLKKLHSSMENDAVIKEKIISIFTK